MASYCSKNISLSLLKKGFSEDNNDHKKYTLFLDGKRTNIRTKVSHGTKEYGERLIREMRTQLRLSKREFMDLIDCPMTKEEYIQILIEKGFIQLNT